MVVLSHPTGNTFVRAAARALHASGSLYAFYTAIATSPRQRVSWLPGRLQRQLARRRFVDVPQVLIKTHPMREVTRLAAEALHLGLLSRPGAWASIDAVYEAFDRHVATQVGRLPSGAPVSGVYCYEDAAEHTLRAARNRGLLCVYELPIAHWQTTQRLLQEEAERLPAWRQTIQGLDDKPEKLDRKDRELALADTVVVPSRFVLDSLPTDVLATRRCVVVPFGSPLPSPLSDQPVRSDGRLRVLFAGAMTQRKGLADLFAAIRLLDRSDVELVVMGSMLAPMSFYRSQLADFTYEAPRPHDEVLSLMRSCDVLALPAIVEGRALVQQEALASGLPLLVTPNAGADDLIEQGKTGFLIPIRAPQALAERIAWFADHRASIPEMRQHARRKAADTGWAAYEAQVRAAVAPVGSSDAAHQPARLSDGVESRPVDEVSR
jgi:glycosyltransferase involved in cell wall biosynthesis